MSDSTRAMLVGALVGALTTGLTAAFVYNSPRLEAAGLGAAGGVVGAIIGVASSFAVPVASVPSTLEAQVGGETLRVGLAGAGTFGTPSFTGRR